MEAEEDNNSASSGKTSWLLTLLCPCLSSSCGCLKTSMSDETKPMRWFQVEKGQLQSVPKKKLTKRRKHSKSTKVDKNKRAETNTVTKNLGNSPAAIIINKESSETDGSRKWRPLNVSDSAKNRNSMSDLLKHLVFTARELSAPSSEAPSCDSETPPLLRSEGDTYQPHVIMEIASSPETNEDNLDHPIEAREIQDADQKEGDEQAVNV